MTSTKNTWLPVPSSITFDGSIGFVTPASHGLVPASKSPFVSRPESKGGGGGGGGAADTTSDTSSM